MKMKALRTTVTFVLMVAAAGIPGGYAQSLLIRDGTIIDGTGKPPIEHADVLIRDGVITEITTSSRAAADTIETIDARGKFILPGLIDSHVHYRDWKGELLLAHGVTTVYDLGNPYYWQAALKQGFNSGGRGTSSAARCACRPTRRPRASCPPSFGAGSTSFTGRKTPPPS
jgi:hypothetical protein